MNLHKWLPPTPRFKQTVSTCSPSPSCAQLSSITGKPEIFTFFDVCSSNVTTNKEITEKTNLLGLIVCLTATMVIGHRAILTWVGGIQQDTTPCSTKATRARTCLQAGLSPINGSDNTWCQGFTNTSLHIWANMSETGQVMGFMKGNVHAQEKVKMLKSNVRGMTFRLERTPKPQHWIPLLLPFCGWNCQQTEEVLLYYTQLHPTKILIWSHRISRFAGGLHTWSSSPNSDHSATLDGESPESSHRDVVLHANENLNFQKDLNAVK